MININNEQHNELCVGIDLGTTNSVLATINQRANGTIVSKVVELPRALDVYSSVTGKSRLDMRRSPLLPSCVYYREENAYEPLVGDFARKQYALRPHLVAKSIKSQMGRATATGLAEEVPDKTPAQISARILRHMLQEAGKIYRQPIDDAVITVPANFDSVMCKATREAAAMAGIKVNNKDGSERPVLLTEPNAVIYDLINQVQNGELSEQILDLQQERQVMVFDLGGGTLDITLHTIKRREDNPEILKVEEVATNRYTLLGGDDFDQAIADVMYEHYLQQYAAHPEAVRRLRELKSTIMPQLLNYAESLKLDLSEAVQNKSQYASEDGFGWDSDEDEGFPVGGNMGGIGYAYDDSFTQEQIEKILEPLMGNRLQLDAYKCLESVADTRNIIYPILDVLQKGAAKLGDRLHVDAVIVNGGMSKFYMVIERLRKFFGLEPIVALDPDQAVARGAAVYHYYLHKYEQQMEEDMRLVGAADAPQQQLAMKADSGLRSKPASQSRPLPMGAGIEFGRSILNDSLYLGLQNGAVQELIPSGSELPYTSEVMRGFMLNPGREEIAIPIKRRNLDNTYVTIANGHLLLNRKYPEGAYVGIRVLMNSSKVITMQMELTGDIEGTNVLQTETAEILVGEGGSVPKLKMVAPSGTRLNVANELHMLESCCNRLAARGRNSDLSKRVAQCVGSIISAGNKDEFAQPVLELLGVTDNQELRHRLFAIARRQAPYWTEEQRRQLVRICERQLLLEMNGFPSSGSRVNVNIQAIYALGCYGTPEEVRRLRKLDTVLKYYTQCLYAFGKAQVEGKWLYEKLYADIYERGDRGNLQATAQAMAMALRRDTGRSVDDVDVTKVVKDLCYVLDNRAVWDVNYISGHVCTIIALGYACDQRYGNNPLPEETLRMAERTLRGLERNYAADVYSRLKKSATVALKMLTGALLSADEEAFLLKKLDI